MNERTFLLTSQWRRRIVHFVHHTSDEIQRAREHVRGAERRIAEQRRLIAQLQRNGQPADEAHLFLRTMLDILEDFRSDLQQSKDQIGHSLDRVEVASGICPHRSAAGRR